MTRVRVGRRFVASAIAWGLLAGSVSPLAAGAQESTAAAAPARDGASLAEKIACVYLLVGGSIMLYYGPRERENGLLTMDGKSEAVAGAASIGLSVALLHDIITRRRASRTTPPAAAPASSSRSGR